MKMLQAINVSYYFMTTNFRFKTEKLEKLYSELDEGDQRTFYFDHTTIDWVAYHRKGIEGVRKFIFKEDDSTIPLAQAKLKKLFYADRIIKALLSLVALGYSIKLMLWMKNQL